MNGPDDSVYTALSRGVSAAIVAAGVAGYSFATGTPVTPTAAVAAVIAATMAAVVLFGVVPAAQEATA